MTAAGRTAPQRNEFGDAPLQTRLLARPAFRAYWLARVAAQTAQGALLYGLLVFVVDKTSESIWASLFVLCSIVPSLLFGLIGGWTADRLPQRALLFWLSVARMALVILLLRADITLGAIFAVTLGIWTVHQFFSPTESAVMPRLIGVQDLASGSALANLALTLAQVLGMVILAPLMLRMPSERYLFAACALLFASAAFLYVRMGPLHEPVKRRPRPLSLRRGWQVVRDDRNSYSAMIDTVLIGIGLSTLVVIVPQYLVRVLDTSASNTVFVFAPAVVGLVVGLQTAPSLGRAFGHGRVATAGLLGFAAAIACFGVIDNVINFLNGFHAPLTEIQSRFGLSQRVTATMLLSIPAGYFSALTNVGARTVLLERTPADLRGQVFATLGTIGNAGALLPTLVAGLAIDQFGVQPVALSVAVVLVTMAVVARRLANDDEPIGSQNLWSAAVIAGMPQESIGILRFAETAARLKRVRRQGWVDRGVRDPESSADHSWSVALLAWLLARDRPDLNRDRVLLLALVHDLPEALAGDTTPFDDERDATGRLAEDQFRATPEYTDAARSEKTQREAAALEEMIVDLPRALAEDVRAAWHEYEERATPEARFVRQVDKLETLLQAESYRAQQRHVIIESFLLGAKRDITDAELVRLLDTIAAAHPREYAYPSDAEPPGREVQAPAAPPEPVRRRQRQRRDRPSNSA